MFSFLSLRFVSHKLCVLQQFCHISTFFWKNQRILIFAKIIGYGRTHTIMLWEPLKTGLKRENEQSTPNARKADEVRLYALRGGLKKQVVYYTHFHSNEVFRGDLYFFDNIIPKIIGFFNRKIKILTNILSSTFPSHQSLTRRDIHDIIKLSYFKLGLADANPSA